MALHGGSGNGRGFLWSWLRDARSRGAILVAPTATGNTWALMGEDTDTPNLMRILESVRARWNVDAERMLLTGMSDGGTFCYVTGFDGASPFTHLAPVSATFHPLMAEMADADRLRGLPIHIVHGRLDWMFPVQVARQTSQALSAAGANVTYRELDDLSHCYPREMNAEILQWLNGGAVRCRGTIPPGHSRYQPQRRDCHADVCRNDFGCAAAGLRRLCLRFHADVERRERPGRPGQPHHRQLGRRGRRLEQAEDARP